MVLVDLGRRISSAVTNLNRTSKIDESAFDSMLKEICNALITADVNVKLVANLRTSIRKSVNFNELAPGVNKKRIIQKCVFDELVKLVNPETEGFQVKKNRSNVIMLVGLQGAGKTTTSTKLGKFYQTRGFKTCLVCADTFRAGAFDQLKQNAIKAQIPYYGNLLEPDPAVVAKTGVDNFKKERFEVIIVDTSGRHKQEQELFDEMIQIQKAVQPDQTIMVLDGSIGQAAESQCRAFKDASNYAAIIITKTDGAAAGGGAISAVAATHTPIVFLGTGEHIFDLERFSPKPFINKLLGFGDMAGLVEHVQTMNFTQKSTIKNIAQGLFTLRDMRDQLSGILQMGPLTKMANMIPGLSGMIAGMDEEEGAIRLKRMIYICDSMTMKELDGDARVFVEQPSRIVRIAKGSGTNVREVEELLTQHRVMANMAKKMKGGLQNMQKVQAQLSSKNPRQQLGAAQRRMASLPETNDFAGLMKMMGGSEALSSLTGSSGKLPDISQLMKLMGGATRPPVKPARKR